MKHLVTPSLLLALLSTSAGLMADDHYSIEPRNSQTCWVIRTGDVELSLTQLGGHMAPVTFYREEVKPVQPYHITPWQGEGLELPAPIMVPLRGDFFCLPFGGNNTEYNGEKHPPHGETSGSFWKLVSAEKDEDVTTLAVELETEVRPGTVTKKLHLRDGENVVYSTHTIRGFAGKTPLGHHATLGMPDEEGVFKISHSPIKFGLVNPEQFSVAANGEYQQLEPGDKFSRLTKVESIFRSADDVDVSRLPQKTGYSDLLAIFSRDNLKHPAWTTAVNSKEGWLWFSLKDPEVLPATVFWLENRGRHGSPWLGRNNCVGLEDVCAFFADGIADSVGENIVNRRGIKTAHQLTADKPFNVHYIQGVAKVPEGFEEVKSIEFGDDNVTFVSTNGQRETVSVHHKFLVDGKF